MQWLNKVISFVAPGSELALVTSPGRGKRRADDTEENRSSEEEYESSDAEAPRRRNGRSHKKHRRRVGVHTYNNGVTTFGVRVDYPDVVLSTETHALDTDYAISAYPLILREDTNVHSYSGNRIHIGFSIMLPEHAIAQLKGGFGNESKELQQGSCHVDGLIMRGERTARWMPVILTLTNASDKDHIIPKGTLMGILHVFITCHPLLMTPHDAPAAVSVPRALAITPVIQDTRKTTSDKMEENLENTTSESSSSSSPTPLPTSTADVILIRPAAVHRGPEVQRNIVEDNPDLVAEDAPRDEGRVYFPAGNGFVRKTKFFYVHDKTVTEEVYKAYKKDEFDRRDFRKLRDRYAREFSKVRAEKRRLGLDVDQNGVDQISEEDK